jgi:putative hemolysin
MSDAARLLIVLALIGANAFFVIAEYAIVTARRGALAPRAEAGSRGAAAALRLMDDPVRVISTVQVGITAVGILTGAVGESAVRAVFGDAVPGWVAFLLAFGAITYLSVVLGELVPKAIALHTAERVAAVIARPVELMGRALAPLVSVLQWSSKLVLRPFGITEVVAGEGVRSAEELRAIVDEAEGSGIIRRDQEELLENVLDLAHLDAGDVMVPAAAVDWLDAGLSPAQAVDRLVRSGHSRFPVGDGTLDRVIGIVEARDLVAAERTGGAATIRELARPAVMVPPTRAVGDLLRDLREARRQLAIVLDEYGRTLGIVSLEDIVEELIGDIADDHDLAARPVWADEATVTVPGATTIHDVNELAGTDLPADARTIGGLLQRRLGRSARRGDQVRIGEVALQAAQVQHARIVDVTVRLGA